jgi:hypothetical protein
LEKAMTSEKSQWDNIVSSWQSDDFESSDSTRALPSDQALKATVESAVKASRIETVISGVMGLALGGYIVSEIIAGLPSVLDYILYGGILTIITLVAFLAVRLKREERRAEGVGTMNYLGLLLNQADANIKMIKIGKFFGLAIIGLIYAIAIWILVQMFLSGNSMAKPVMASVIMGFVTLFFPGMIYFLHKTQKKIVTRKLHLESMLEGLN